MLIATDVASRGLGTIRGAVRVEGGWWRAGERERVKWLQRVCVLCMHLLQFY